MPNSTFSISIPNANAIESALKSSPAIMGPLITKALNASEAILASHTVSPPVPYKTGLLVQTFQADLQSTLLRWFPTRTYAPYVEFGVPPSPGRYVPAIGKRLVNGDNIGMWPGIKPNPYMENIVSLSTDQIVQAFKDALASFNEAMAETSQ